LWSGKPTGRGCRGPLGPGNNWGGTAVVSAANASPFGRGLVKRAATGMGAGDVRFKQGARNMGSVVEKF